MSLNAATIEYLLAKGLTGEDLLEVARRQERRSDPTAAERKRRQRARGRGEGDAASRRSVQAEPVEAYFFSKEPEGRDRLRQAQPERSLGLDSAPPVTRDTPPPESPPTPPKDSTPPLSPTVSDETVPPGISGPQLKPEHVVEAWNATAARLGLPVVRKLTPERRRKLITRIRQNSIDEFTEAIAAVERSPFLRGENDRGWRADFNWMLEPRNFTRLTEGSYDR